MLSSKPTDGNPSGTSIFLFSEMDPFFDSIGFQKDNLDELFKSHKMKIDKLEYSIDKSIF